MQNDLTVHVELVDGHQGTRTSVTDSLNEHLRALQQAGVVFDWHYERETADAN